MRGFRYVERSNLVCIAYLFISQTALLQMQSCCRVATISVLSLTSCRIYHEVNIQLRLIYHFLSQLFVIFVILPHIFDPISSSPYLRPHIFVPVSSTPYLRPHIFVPISSSPYLRPHVFSTFRDPHLQLYHFLDTSRQYHFVFLSVMKFIYLFLLLLPLPCLLLHYYGFFCPVLCSMFRLRRGNTEARAALKHLGELEDYCIANFRVGHQTPTTDILYRHVHSAYRTI